MFCVTCNQVSYDTVCLTPNCPVDKDPVEFAALKKKLKREHGAKVKREKRKQAKKEAPDMPLPKGAVEPKLTPEQKQTREEWLLKFTRDHCADLFAKAGKEIPPKIRMACGWPSSRGLARGKRPRVVGQCWYPEASSDQHHEIFISPVLSDVVDVAATLIHELAHVVCGKEAGHGAAFKETATGVGLEGKMTATVPTSWLKEWIAKAAQEVGVYPHATLDMSQQKKQGTRLLKVVCPDMECDYLAEEEKPYTVRMSASVFDAGKPCCGVCGTRMEVSE